MIPLILLNIDKQRITNYNISKSNCFCICSLVAFDIEVLEGDDCLIYKTILNDFSSEVHEGKRFSKSNKDPNYKSSNQYTIYIGDCKNDKVKIRTSLDFDNVDNITKYNEKIFELEYIPENALDSITEEKYNDWLYNYDLPNYEQLNNAILLSNRGDLIKRMLLDFKSIINRKGTIKSVEKFFNLIGFESSLLHIYEEYIHKSIDINGSETLVKTISPNKLTDKKTGDYHLLYDNAKDEGYNKHNLPIKKTVYEDLDDFFDKLRNSIILANRYFTIQEQDIVFFGLNYYSNIPMLPGITSTMTKIFNHDVHNFEKNISIDLYKHMNSVSKKYFISNTIITKEFDKFYKSEIKVVKQDWNNINPDLFIIDKEYKDDELIIDEDLNHVKTMVGIVLNLDVKCNNCYVEILIHEKENPLNQILISKQFVENSLEIKFANIKSSDYNITVIVWDRWNNREKWDYTYNVTINTDLIGIESYNSTKVFEDINNKLTLDISSPTNTNNTYSNELMYILPLDRIPLDLSEYYNDLSGITNFQFVTNNKQYILPEINPNYGLKDITDTIPLKYNDNYINVVSLPYYEDKRLVLYEYDTTTFRKKLYEIHDIGSIYFKQFTNLYVNVVDVIDETYDENLGINVVTKSPMLFIVSLENGLDFNNKTFDFRFIDNTNSEEFSIYDLDKTECIIKKLPVNYDFPVKLTTSTFVPDFKYYLNNDNIGVDGLIWINSIFPRLININENNESFQVKLGDIIACKYDENLLTDITDITWTIKNSFNKKVLFSTNDYMLKYRINDNICYDIILSFFLDKKQHMIIRKSMFSSFEVK